VKIAINGFGRIGRCFLRAAISQGFFDKHELVAVNSRGEARIAAHLFKRDSVHGAFPGSVANTESSMTVDSLNFAYSHESDPAKLPWKRLGVDLVIEASGAFTNREDASKHLAAGAKKVLLTAPGKGVDATLVPGVNDATLKKEHTIVSMASCTTNCLAPMCSVLLDSFGIEKGYMTTVHAFTGDQRLIDSDHKDLRRARSGAVNIIPTTTGAAKSIGEVLPALKGKMDGVAIRVPVVDSSLVDLTVELSKDADVAAINAAFKKAADKKFKAILEYSDEPLVSTDITRNPHSCVFDSLETNVLGGNLAKVFGWYDNEWGYSNRLVDAAALMAGRK